MEAYNIFLYFMIYSFLGWICETIYCSVPAGHFVYRGFLIGPVTPIYGFGAIFVLLVFQKVANNIPLLFIGSLILTSALEYFTSYLMEKIFDMKWWDYSDRPFNINGRVRLKNSILFGIGSVLVVHYIHPLVVVSVASLSEDYIQLLATILFVILIADTTITVISIFDLKNKIADFEQAVEKKYGAKKANILDRRILQAFPELRDKYNPDVIHRLRQAVAKHRHEIKNKTKNFKKQSDQ